MIFYSCFVIYNREPIIHTTKVGKIHDKVNFLGFLKIMSLQCTLGSIAKGKKGMHMTLHMSVRELTLLQEVKRRGG